MRLPSTSDPSSHNLSELFLSCRSSLSLEKLQFFRLFVAYYGIFVLGRNPAPAAIDLVFESGRFFLSICAKSNPLHLSRVSDVYPSSNIGVGLLVVVVEEEEKQCNARQSSLLQVDLCGRADTKGRIVRFDSVQNSDKLLLLSVHLSIRWASVHTNGTVCVTLYHPMMWHCYHALWQSHRRYFFLAVGKLGLIGWMSLVGYLVDLAGQDPTMKSLHPRSTGDGCGRTRGMFSRVL